MNARRCRAASHRGGLAEMGCGHEGLDGPEHLVGMLGWQNPAREAVIDIEFVEEETGCRRADFGDRIDLLTDQGLHQPGRECGLLF
jgi:hypothetical protein